MINDNSWLHLYIHGMLVDIEKAIQLADKKSRGSSTSYYLRCSRDLLKQAQGTLDPLPSENSNVNKIES